MHIINELIRANGTWLSANEMPGVDESRVDRIIRSVPDQIRSVIEAKRGAGYRLKV